VAHRHVAAGDREQAGQARLRCQQVIETGVELLFGDPVADVEQVPVGVVQEPEVGLPGQRLEGLGQRAQAIGGGGPAPGLWQAACASRQALCSVWR
jgi:hypothetical protein